MCLSLSAEFQEAQYVGGDNGFQKFKDVPLCGTQQNSRNEKYIKTSIAN
jgi:hypothetical protein